MKKIIAYLIIFVLMASPTWSYAANYYGCATASVNSDSTFCATPTGSCTGTDAVTAATALAGTHNLYANGCTLSITDSFTAALVSNDDGDGAGAAVSGGTFTLATGTVSGKTITSNITANINACIAVSGSGAADPVLTVIGNLTGGPSTGDVALSTTHTVGRIVIGSVGTPSTITGGGAIGAYGFKSDGAGPVTAYANAVAATSAGAGFESTATITWVGNATGTGNVAGILNTSTGTVNMTGTCTGATAGYGAGCSATGSGPIVLTGNIVPTDRAIGVHGTFRWNPLVPASGVTGHYVGFDGGGTPIYCGPNTDDVTKATSTFYYIDPTDGATAQGNAAGGGGCACGF